MPTVLNPTGAPSVFGGIGRLEFAPTNAPDDPFPTYVDITPYLRTEDEPLVITRGRQTELDTIQPSQLTCHLDNTDNRFTFGNLAGAYGTNWTPAKQIRYLETIGGRTFQLFKGYIEFPDIDNWQPIGYQEVSLTCTDRLTRLGRGRPFVSTLGEHILFNGGSSLKAYLPLNAVTNDAAPVGPAAIPLLRLTRLTSNPGAAVEAARDVVLPGQGASVYADDIPSYGFNPILTSTNAVAFGGGLGTPTGTASIPVTAGQIFTTAFWVSYTARANNYQLVALNSTPGAGIDLQVVGGAWTLECFMGGFVSVAVPTLAQGTPQLIAIRLNIATGLLEYWRNADPPVTTTAAGTLAATTYSAFSLGLGLTGSVGHFQVYVGTEGYTRERHLAQFQMGLLGLEYQTTGQRINTVLDYAGVPATDRAIDPGQSFMQRASLTGLDPQTALQDAVTTERGRGFAAGDGRYVFHDRIRTYNV